ncbi:hypothetical protein RI367_004867 [Sorochytrium milnesiophthora]
MESMRMLCDLEICSAAGIAQSAQMPPEGQDKDDASTDDGNNSAGTGGTLNNISQLLGNVPADVIGDAKGSAAAQNLGIGASKLLRHLFRQRFSPTSSRSLQQVLTSYVLTHDRANEEDATDYRSAYHQLCDWLYGWNVADVAEPVVGKTNEQLTIRRVPRAFALDDPVERSEARRIMEAFQTLFNISLRTLRRSYMELEDKLPCIGKNIVRMFQGDDLGDSLDEENAVWGKAATNKNEEDGLLGAVESALHQRRHSNATESATSLAAPQSRRASVKPPASRRSSIKPPAIASPGGGGTGSAETTFPEAVQEQDEAGGGNGEAKAATPRGQGFPFPAPPKPARRRTARFAGDMATEAAAAVASVTTPTITTTSPPKKDSEGADAAAKTAARKADDDDIPFAQIVRNDIDHLFLLVSNTCDFTLVCACGSILVLALAECLDEKQAFSRQMQHMQELANLFVSNTLKATWHMLHREFDRHANEDPSGSQNNLETLDAAIDALRPQQQQQQQQFQNKKDEEPDVKITLSQVRDPQRFRLLMHQVLKTRNYKSSDKQFIAMSKMHHKFIILNEVMSGLDIFLFPPFVSAHTEGAKAICPTEFDQNIWASGGYDCALRIWDMTNSTCLAQYVGHRSIVTDVRFTRNDAFILSGSFDRSLKIWNSQNATCERTLMGHTDSVTSCDVSPDGRYIISGSVDNTVRLWDFATGDCIASVKKHTRYIKMVRFSPDGRYAASAGLDRRIYIWDVKIFAYSKNVTHTRCIEAHDDYILAIAIARPSLLVSSSRDQTVKLWDYITGQCFYIIKLAPSWACSLSFSYDGDMFATGSFDNIINIFKTRTGERLRSIRVFNLGISSVSFCNKSNAFIVCGTSEGLLQKIQL